MSNDLKQFKKSLNEIKENTHSLEKNKPGEPKTPNEFIFVQTLFVALFVYFFGQTIISGFSLVHNIILNFFLGFDNSVFYMPIYTISVTIIVIILYYDFFIFFLWRTATIGFKETMRNLNKGLPKWQYIVGGVLLLLISLDAFALDATTDSNDVLYFGEEKVDETGDSINSMWDEFICTIRPQCIAKKEQQDEDTQSSSTSYSVDIENTLSSYRKSQLENRPLPINLEVESKGGNLFLNKLECYKGHPRDNNLIHTQDLRKREIENENPTSVGGISCDLSKIDVDKTKQIEITPVIYYTIGLDYTQELPIIDYNKYIQEQDENYLSLGEIKSRFDVEDPVNTAKTALSIKRYINPQLPIIINHPDSREDIYFMELTLEKSSARLGELNSTKLISIDNPEEIIQFNNVKTPILIDAYDEETSIPLDFSVTGLNDDSTNIEIPVKMKFNNTMIYEESLDFRVVVN